LYFKEDVVFYTGNYINLHHPMAQTFYMARDVYEEAKRIAERDNVAIPYVRMRLIDIRTAEQRGARIPQSTHRGRFDTPQMRFNNAFGQIAQV
jgi:hypothetical protein